MKLIAEVPKWYEDTKKLFVSVSKINSIYRKFWCHNIHNFVGLSYSSTYHPTYFRIRKDTYKVGDILIWMYAATVLTDSMHSKCVHKMN